jgi:outer membrane biosynthesis protein TonB
MKQAAAAPLRRPRRIWLATIVLAISSLGFASSQALAGEASPSEGPTEPTPTTATTPPPSPDPQPAPKPDPKPNRPKQRARVAPPPPPPPPPPPAARRAPRRSSPETTVAPRAQPAAPRPKAVPRKKPAPIAAVRPGQRSRLASAAKARRKSAAVRAKKSRPVRAKKSRPVRPKSAEVRKLSRRLRPASAEAPLDLNGTPTPVFARSDPSLSSAAPVVLPLFVLGLLLLLGATVVSVRRLPRPAVAEPLYARRLDLAAIGVGAIALALLWLNVTVVF